MILNEKKVFTPNATTDLLVSTTLKILKKKSDVLDLGCGTGFVGLTVAKNTKLKNSYYFSDLSKKAIIKCKKNAKKNKLEIIAKYGNMFEPWEGRKFDIIIESVSAIAKQVADVSPWYNKNIPCESGDDGTLLITSILKSAKKYLKKGGKIIFPIVSFSKKNKILSVAKKNYSNIKMLSFRDWPLPKSMYKHENLFKKLKKKGFVDYKTKYGIILYTSYVFLATK